MRILFIHQNFPGQFKHLAPALVKQGHEVCALTSRANLAASWMHVKIVQYAVTPPKHATHPLLADMEVKTARGEAVYRKSLELKAQGYTPDIVIAHPSWGESMFIKDVWPHVKLGIYSEFFYNADHQDVGFDPEFPSDPTADKIRLRMKNLNQLLHFDMADAGLSPTKWQASTFPESFQKKISVIHDGIDTRTIQPNPKVTLTLNGQCKLTTNDEVITFVNRNLEPYRGYHIFMRALPEILQRRPKAHVLIVGGDQVSYGAKAPEGTSWRAKYYDEIVAKLGADELKRIHFLGKMPYQDYLALLQLSSLHMYLTYPFVLSWSLLEAMSTGCAILASNTAPVREVIQDGVTGKLVNFFEVQEFAEQACQTLADRELRLSLGQSARIAVQMNYDLHEVCLPEQLGWVEKLANL